MLQQQHLQLRFNRGNRFECLSLSVRPDDGYRYAAARHDGWGIGLDPDAVARLQVQRLRRDARWQPQWQDAHADQVRPVNSFETHRQHRRMPSRRWPFAAQSRDEPVSAQEFPTKPITIVVAFAAGGNNDLRACQIGVPLSSMLGKPVIVDNKPGASGNVGHEIIARAAADGYTLDIGAMGPLAVNPYVWQKVNFKPLQDFTPIVLVGKAPLVLVTRVDKPFRTVKDVVAAAKAKPGTLNIGNAGAGGAHHLSAEIFKQSAGIFMLSVPYKGGGPAATALLSGEIDMMFDQTYAALPSIQAGKTRALAVTSEKRLPSLPDVPTMAELGYPKATISNWLGFIGPKGMPPAVVLKLNESNNKILAQPDIQEKIAGPGNVVGGGTAEVFAEFIAAENKRWEALAKSANIKVEQGLSMRPLKGASPRGRKPARRQPRSCPGNGTKDGMSARGRPGRSGHSRALRPRHWQAQLNDPDYHPDCLGR